MIYSYSGLKLYPNRDDKICSLCAGKSVLHVGATDAPFTEQKLANGLLLHTKLSARASKVVGIDIDEEAIAFLGSRGIDNIVKFDMNQMGAIAFAPEVIVFGEIIEHLLNFDVALANLRAAMNTETRLVITTPNLMYLGSLLRVLYSNREQVHPDHMVGFTAGLLRQMLDRNGLRIVEQFFCFLPRRREGWKKKLLKMVIRARPGLAETLLVVCTREW